DDMVERLDMGARRDLRHHAAIGLMLGGLRQHEVGEDFAASVLVAPHHRGGGLVAGRLDAENEHSHLVVNPGRPEGAGPESISTNRGYGFQARKLRSRPGMTVYGVVPRSIVRSRDAIRTEYRNTRPPAGAGAGAADAR